MKIDENLWVHQWKSMQINQNIGKYRKILNIVKNHDKSKKSFARIGGAAAAAVAAVAAMKI